MPVIPIPNSASTTIAPNGPGFETVQFFGLDGVTAPPAANLTTATFIATDDKIITADANAVAGRMSQIVSKGAGGFITQDLSAGSDPAITDKANFATPGLGPVAQYVNPVPDSTLFTPHDMLVDASAPGVFILTGGGNDVLKAGAGSNILDGGSGQNMFYAGGPNALANGPNTFIADARTAGTTDFIAALNAGDNVIIAGNFASVAAGIGLTGLDFQLTGFNGAPSADVTLGNIKAEVNINLSFGFDTNSSTGVNYFFIHRTS